MLPDHTDPRPRNLSPARVATITQTFDGGPMARDKTEQSTTEAKPERSEPIKPMPFPGESPTVALAMAAGQMYGLHEEDGKPAKSAPKKRATAKKKAARPTTKATTPTKKATTPKKKAAAPKKKAAAKSRTSAKRASASPSKGTRKGK